MDSRRYKHEDDGEGAKVSYEFNLTNIETSRPGLEIGFYTMAEMIYHNSARTHILYPPGHLKLKFNNEDLVNITALLVEAASVYMAGVRKEFYQRDTLYYDFVTIDQQYLVSFQAVNKKFSSVGKQKNSPRLILVIKNLTTKEEILAVKIKKTKIYMFLQIIKNLLDESIEKLILNLGDKENMRHQIIKINDFIAIGSIWIHGREIQKFQDFVERIVFDFKFHIGSGSEMFRYRQVSAAFSELENIMELKLIKFGKNHKVEIGENGEKTEFSFLVNSKVAAAFFMALPRAISFDLQDVEIFSDNPQKTEDSKRVALAIEAGFSEEEIQEIRDEEAREIKKDRQEKSSLTGGDFILNTIEAQIALSVDDKQFNTKTKNGKISLAIRYRDFVLEDKDYKVGRTNKFTGVYEEVNILPKFNIDLRMEWLEMFASIVESLHRDSYDELKYGQSRRSWKFSKKSFLGGYDHYLINVLNDPDNKAKVVLLVDNYFTDEEDGEFSEGMGSYRMRIPLFKEHIRTLIKGVIGLAIQFESYHWNRKLTVYSDDYSEEMGEYTFGFKRAYNEARKEELVSFGVVGRSSEQIYLTENDRDSLFFSAYYRLMYGRWLQFSGEQIAITFDGWLTDRYNEYDIEESRKSANGANGAAVALAMLFATARNKTKVEVNEQAA